VRGVRAAQAEKVRLLGHYVTHLKKVGGGPKCAALLSCAHACGRMHVQAQSGELRTCQHWANA
jgi:hypothetical protein